MYHMKAIVFLLSQPESPRIVVNLSDSEKEDHQEENELLEENH
jgi:hypothetical protein